MGLNITKGNMYPFINHTWNAIKGECYHDCSYCYMKRWNNQKPVRLDRSEFKTELGSKNFIFVGSSCDIFSENIPAEWIKATINHCTHFPENKYLFQSKNPLRMKEFEFPKRTWICATVETNRRYSEIMGITPSPQERAIAMAQIKLPKFLTIEPIMDFDFDEFLGLINSCKPQQVNIGADSGRNDLPEPDTEKLKRLIWELEGRTKVLVKSNLKRLLKGGM